ncbi:PREDICTED: G-type lectin S-receptor-like serine/threonine-protein kinase SD2-5 [Theobroma cacao]|uniref:Receptor-like serine/threonine-protein kinase n=1 Tax=Theobroma cacao TaxID=3641 RepID=A0AB32WLB1_THECC|nr:PREDICTED: G-type lectin S-receptor-like serine/threonine-protein kinase SD2-5 [Theobroma cacao]
MACLKWMVQYFFLIFCSTLNSVISQRFPSTRPPGIWKNNPSNRSWNFNDGTQVRPILAKYSYGRPNFGFGFFKNGSTNAFYLVVIKFRAGATLATSEYDPPPILVWSANRNDPVGENATLELTASGNMVLKESDGSRVWSTNTISKYSTSISLNGKGDLRLKNSVQGFLWHSFANPTDAWLVGQHFRLPKQLSSSVSSTNFSIGMFYLTISDGGLQAFFASDPPQMYRAIFPFQRDYLLYNFSCGFLNYTDGHVYYGSERGDFQYIRLESNGHLNVYLLADGYKETLMANLLEDKQLGDCIFPTVCGRYGICSDGRCTCPGASRENVSYFRPLDATHPGSGCAEINPPSCLDTKLHTFQELGNVTYFSFEPQLYHTDIDRCKKECLSDCHCKAAFFKYEVNMSDGNCSLLTELFSLMAVGKSASTYNNFAFIKVQSPSDRKKSFLVLTLASSLSSLLICTVLFIGSYHHYAKRRNKFFFGRQREDNFTDESSLDVSTVLKKYSFEDMISATKNFNLMLGKGGFGTVSQGTLENGEKVAVKQLGSDVQQGKKEFVAEVKTVGSIHHFNLVRLMGYCAERCNRLLVYEYMCNGSLDKWIFNQSKAQALTWEIRQKIIVGIAKGLEYLHHYCNKNIIHFDIKPQNILLDKDFNAKISDFGLARLFDKNQSHVSSLPRGTPGYIAPELIRGHDITAKIDVYSLGVVILEIICGRRNSDSPGDYLIDIVKMKVEQDRLADLVDDCNNDMQVHKEDAVKVMKIAISCLQTNRYRRPTASKVVKFLEGSMDIEPISDYSFLTIIHGEAPVAIVDRIDSSLPMASILSGPR